MKLRRSLLATLLVLAPLAALGPGPAAAAPPGHVTPTALACRDGHLYVGNLTLFPIQRARPRSSGSPWTAATSRSWPGPDRRTRAGLRPPGAPVCPGDNHRRQRLPQARRRPGRPGDP